MTPTPEEIALAEEIAGEPHGGLYDLARTVALVAIMKVRDKASDTLENVWSESELAERVRNGEHLR